MYSVIIISSNREGANGWKNKAPLFIFLIEYWGRHWFQKFHQNGNKFSDYSCIITQKKNLNKFWFLMVSLINLCSSQSINSDQIFHINIQNNLKWLKSIVSKNLQFKANLKWHINHFLSVMMREHSIKSTKISSHILLDTLIWVR